MDPRDNLGLANYLVVPPHTPPEEASYRGACGRAYYAAFLFSREALKGLGHSISGHGGAHKEVADKLKSSNRLDVRQLGGILENLHQIRKDADYTIVNSIVKKSLGTAAISLAEKIIHGLSTCPDSNFGIPAPTP